MAQRRQVPPPSFPYRSIDHLHATALGDRPLTARTEGLDASTFEADIGVGDTWTAFIVGPWFVIMELGVVDGRLETTRIDIRSRASRRDDAVTPIRFSHLRRIPFAQLERDSRRLFKASSVRNLVRTLEKQGIWPQDDIDEARAAGEAEQRAVNAPRLRQGRPLLATSDLKKALKAYRNAVLRGKPPRKAVAKACSLSDSGASKRIKTLRDLGVLPPTTKGVAKTSAARSSPRSA